MILLDISYLGLDFGGTNEMSDNIFLIAMGVVFGIFLVSFLYGFFSLLYKEHLAARGKKTTSV
ncbi:MAG: hypothetical protein LBB53_02740 [Prevotellaceae bacterium]|nr:hypothetical protein [Prevotellaceae bacterium]